MYQGHPELQKSGTVRPNLASATYASIVTAGIAPNEDQVQDVTSETDCIAEIGSAKSTVTGLRLPGEDIDINVAQALAPDTPDTRALPDPPDGAHTFITDTVQNAALVEPRQIMEVQEPHGDFTISQTASYATYVRCLVALVQYDARKTLVR
jgi:hypothetical protein